MKSKKPSPKIPKFNKSLPAKHRNKIMRLLKAMKMHPSEHPSNPEIFLMRLEGNTIEGIRGIMTKQARKKFTPGRIRHIEGKYLWRLEKTGKHPEAIQEARKYLNRL